MKVYSSPYFDRGSKLYWDDRKGWWTLVNEEATSLTDDQQEEINLITAGKLLRLPENWQRLGPRKLKNMMRKVNRRVEEQGYRMERLVLWASRRVKARDAVEEKVEYLLLKHKAEKCACLYRESRLRGCKVAADRIGLKSPALQTPRLQYFDCGRCKLKHPETTLLAAKLNRGGKRR